MNPPLSGGILLYNILYEECINNLGGQMSPRNYNAKFTPGSDPDFWWRFTAANTHYSFKEKNELLRKKSLINKIILKFKRNHNKDFT